MGKWQFREDLCEFFDGKLNSTEQDAAELLEDAKDEDKVDAVEPVFDAAICSNLFTGLKVLILVSFCKLRISSDSGGSTQNCPSAGPASSPNSHWWCANPS